MSTNRSTVFLGMAYKGEGSNTLYTATFDGRSWYGNTKINTQPGNVDPESDRSPGVVMFQDELVLVYKKAGTNDLYIANFNGTRWYGGIPIKTQSGNTPVTDIAPNLIAFNDALYVVYKGAGSNSIYLTWTDGNTWFDPVAIEQMPGNVKPQTDDTPRPVVYNGSLYIIYKQPNSGTLYSAWFDGSNWHGGATVSNAATNFNPTAKYNPTAIEFAGKLCMVYRNETSEELYSAWFDGTAWAGPEPVGVLSQFSPGALVLDGKLVIVFKIGDSVTLSWAWFDGSSWGGGERIEVLKGNVPESNYNPELALMPFVPGSQAQWMKGLPDDILISNINLPGTHDSAAITTTPGVILARHDESITSQLMNGVRLLDIRLKVKVAPGPTPSLTFVTCHDDILSSSGMNEYQSFQSVLEECWAFLVEFPTEFIAMSLKIDDWNGYASQATQVFDALYQFLASPDAAWSPDGFPAASYTIPTLADVRGRFFLLNRLNDDRNFGVPLSWPGNTPFSHVILKADGAWQFDAYVQDEWNWLVTVKVEAAKMQVFWDAPGKIGSGDLLLNFASGVDGAVFPIDIKPQWLEKLGSFDGSTRPTRLGWSLFDFETSAYQVVGNGMVTVLPLIIASNFGYAGYESKFDVITPDDTIAIAQSGVV